MHKQQPLAYLIYRNKKVAGFTFSSRVGGYHG